MTTGYCGTCKQSTFALFGAHKCAPRWLVWRPENGESSGDARVVYAIDAERAALDTASRSDSDGEHNIARGNEAVFHVRPFGEALADVAIFRVDGETVPSYSARKTGIALRSPTCRKCGECDGEHHFSDAYRAEDGCYVCKHCDVLTPECESCGEAVPFAMTLGEPDAIDDANGPLCAECKQAVREDGEGAA